MSRDWTPEELQKASEIMKANGHMGYEEFCEHLDEQEAHAALERFGKVQTPSIPCPRCGRMTMDPENVLRNALSRHADIYICDECGTDEAMRDFAMCVLPIDE